MLAADHGSSDRSRELRPQLRIKSDILEILQSEGLKVVAEAAPALKIHCSIVVSICACHAEDPGSISEGGVFLHVHGCSLTQSMRHS